MNRRFSMRRGGLFALATGLLFLIAGDRGVTQIPQGIDPLEVLNLQIKPNVAILLDTSGSMTETPYGSGTLGDHPGSKMYQAKQVLKSVVTANQGSVNFLFGSYLFATQPSFVSCPGGGCTGDLRINAKPVRFRYSTTSWAATTTPALPVEGPSPAMAVSTTEATLGNLYAFQWIQNSTTIKNNQLVYSESAGPTCTVVVPPGFYTGLTLATALGVQMNACPGKANVYTVSYATGVFTFSKTGVRQFTLQWGSATSTLRAPFRMTANQGPGNGPFATTDGRINLLQRSTTDKLTPNCGTATECYDPDGAAGPSPIRAVTTYWLYAQKLWNGETIQVDGTGLACNIIPGTPTAPDPTVTLQRLSACGTPTIVSTNTFTWSGGSNGGAGTCQTGFEKRVPFFNCRADVVQPGVQSTAIQPFLRNEVPLDGAGGLSGYTESTDGTGDILTMPNPGGVMASGNTPMAQSFEGFRTFFGGAGGLWSSGQALPFPQNLTAISTHPSPKERTIVIMVTDGDQNCTPFVLGSGAAGAPYNPTTMIQDDAAALGAAMAAQRLYDPVANGTNSGTVAADGTINGDPGGSVTTYLVAFGNGASATRANWIAWGGSGMNRSGANVGTFSGQPTWTTFPSTAERNACKTCVDAFIAPDAATLTDVLTKLLNQGATTGEFSSQQSLSDSIVEYVGEAPFANTAGTALPDPADPATRYRYLSPVRFAATFAMPLFTGKVRAYTNDGPDALAKTGAACIPGQACERWDANANLVTRVSTGMTSGCPASGTVGNTVGECSFKRLAGYPSATDLSVRTSTAAIKRRIYTTSQNGVFGPTVDNLLLSQSPFRIALWPPQIINPKSVAPQDDTSEGLFDAAMGLPPDSTPAAQQGTAFNTLQTSYKACKGAPLVAACTGTVTAQMKRARREAREMLLAFLAGAQYVPDVNGDPKRSLGTLAPDYAAGDIIYAARTSIVAESTLATPAVIGPPQDEEPAATDWVSEYKLYRDGPRCASNGPCDPVIPGGTGYNPDSPNGTLLAAGFGLRNPDKTADSLGGRDNRSRLKPVMSVLYAGTNSALHAFRAGPNVYSGPGVSFAPVTPPAVPTISNNNPAVCVPSATVECGGDELWAFVPFDQLNKLQGRYLTNPQKRSPHDYMIARAIRFSDLFIPDPGTADNPSGLAVAKNSVGGSSIKMTLKGVWRKVMFFGRGAGGSYLTAIDVTAPAPFTGLSLDATGPIVLWNRGNPDTSDGQLLGGGNVLNNSLTGSGPGSDYDAYLRMGQTWSVPAVGLADRSANKTARKSAGADFVAYVGSGYGKTGAAPVQGTTFYTLDALTGDVIKSVDVGSRTGMAYDNAIVANPAVFNPSRFVYQSGGVPAPNVAAGASSRAYFGDIHGRMWKVLSSKPDVEIPMADLGPNEAVATAVAILGLPANDPAKKPHIMVTSGNDSRATGPFFAYAFRDDGDNSNITTQPGVVANGVTTFPPVVSIFSQDLGTNFRGTVQPSVVYSDTLKRGLVNDPAGRVFFGATRFNPVNSTFAPTNEPCRSSFDSVIFALGVETGLAAYDFGPSKLFQNSRVAAITTGASPLGSQLIVDEGLVKSGQPIPPPPAMGQSPNNASQASVVPLQRAGQPLTTVRFGSTICQ